MSEKPRILVVLPMYGGSLPVGRFCVSALRDLGCTVDVFEAPDFFSAFQGLSNLRVSADRLDYLENSFLQLVSQAVLAKVETVEPDLVLCMAQAPLNRQALKRLERDKVLTAMWFVEDFRVFTYWRAFAPLYSAFAVIQKEPFLAELAEAGVQHALYLPLAALPEFHRPLELSPTDRREFGADVSFLGAGYPNRKIAFRQLAHLNFKIWGTEWEGDTVLSRFVQRQGVRISSEDAVKIYSATRINLNLHSSVQAKNLVSQGDFVNPRTFELAACGAFQLVDERALMPELFASDELATFSAMPELLEKIAHYLSRSEERLAIAEKGRTRVLAEHTYQRRMGDLLAFLKERFPAWPAQRQSARLPEDLPPALASELAELFGRLNLSVNADFADVIAAVRGRQGELTGIETALLFLDEWQKQYKR